ncbi:hypothetical protein M3204_03590 [Mesobacillus subterraneus]|uniref:hypothetical protein n=1 Tax=Mesobacillus subterraneus TaxID=285983 RepID=UPI00203ED348|nr:hypothetical protein [Mesobacillus subterraneus]MCM3663470.1 hypothetical protein [Mesobacillus subterraneus]MCM3683240.1 hypothetical protein [Mesobacillus subterraneus]
MRTIQGELTKWASKNKVPLKKQRDKKVKAKPMVMTTREVQELMGIYKPTYRRSKGGAIRQK